MPVEHYFKPGDKIKSYTITKILGEGRYGIAYLAEDSTSTSYVIKQFKKQMIKASRDEIFYEQEILKSLNSPKFPKFVGTFFNEQAEGFVMEYISGRVFEDYLFRDNRKFTRLEIYNIADKLLEIINLLQAEGIVHRDIRLPNVIVNPNHELILIDFGLARFIDHLYYVKQMDYWYLGDFLLHLFYTTQPDDPSDVERPWYEELTLSPHERHFLKRLMGLEKEYDAIEDIQYDLNQLLHLL